MLRDAQSNVFFKGPTNYKLTNSCDKNNKDCITPFYSILLLLLMGENWENGHGKNHTFLAVRNVILSEC